MCFFGGLEGVLVKEEDNSLVLGFLGNDIWDVFYNYVMEDFCKNIDVVVLWLCEEWYNDKFLKKLGGDYFLYYEKCIF